MSEPMTADSYLDQRIDQYKNWYDGKASFYKKNFQAIRLAAVGGAVLVPVLVNIIRDPDLSRYLATFVSTIVSLVVALESVFHFGDMWKNYRSTSEFLLREKIFFQTKTGPYKELKPEPAFALLVERCEGQIAAENSATLNVIVTAVQQPEPGVGAGKPSVADA